MKIEKCPFCGGEASYRDDGWWEKVYDEGGAIVDVDISSPCVFVIECSCGAQIVSDESEDAVRAAWNRRADHIRDTTKKVTNADRIRSMSDEELAKEMLFFVPSDFNRHYTGIAGGYYATADEAIQANFDWLQQPAKEE